MIGIDGGIRRGSDVFKALALGADMCFAGRIPYWGLFINGQDGVERALQILREEFGVCIRLSSCKSLADIGPHSVAIVLGGFQALSSAYHIMTDRHKTQLCKHIKKV